MNKIVKIAALGAAVVLIGGLAACSPAGVSDPGSSSGTNAIEVVYIPKNLGNPYFDNIVAGFEEASTSLNMNVQVVGPAQAGATDQIQYIDAAIQQGVDAIAISPNDADALVPSLKRAMDAGIVVVSVNSDMNPEGRDVAVLPTDFDTLGEFLVNLTSEVTGGKGDFAVLSATSTAPDQNFWIDGMRASLEGGAAPDLNLVDVVYGDDAPDKSANETTALLTKFPNLAAINAPTTVGVAAAAQIISASPQKGKVQVTGLGTPNEMRQYVKDGTVKAFALWDPKAQGVLTANLIAALVNGTTKASSGATFEVPGVGTRTISPTTQVITGPPVTFNADNIDDYNF
ncbi:MAG: substrate-binding domain-containing protein [Actinomycetales bacterium]|nr:substrate-binding domain-containing protein [Actinomycetales bacterium]